MKKVFQERQKLNMYCLKIGLKRMLFLIITASLLTIFIYYYNIFCKVFLKGNNAQKNEVKNATIRIQNVYHIAYNHYIDSAVQETTDNFIFFVKFAYEPCNPEMHYTFLLNLDNTNKDIYERLYQMLGMDLVNKIKQCLMDNHASRINNKNTRIIVQKNWRDVEFCGYVKHFDSSYMKDHKSFYKYFFFINSSARGPFLPNYWLKPWFISIFIKILMKFNLNFLLK